ncbi:MAG TPA: Hsp70 family protein [Caulobacterales bacterium]|nr:Hsp70 family protein [Caulobacterales bacterium]
MAFDGDLTRARICIDFGTALSKASVCLDPALPLEVGVRPLAIGAVSGAEHHLLTPSVLFVDGGRIFFGPRALEIAWNGAGESRDPLLSFKTVLGARNAQEALAAKLPPSIDPTGTFRLRDALALYLAYLDQLIRAALESSVNMPPGVVNVPRRYTSPAWSAGSSSDRVFEAIFNEAAAVSARLSKLLLSPDGISIAQCRDALDKAAATPGDGRLETGVFEPHAAAAASLAFTNSPVRFVMVIDIGAGTTDIAAFEFDERNNPPSLTEIKPARQCSALAGDEIDRILINLFGRKRSGERSIEEEERMRRLIRLAARDLKQQLFTEGRCTVRNGWSSTTIRISDLAEDPQFRAYHQALGQLIAHSIGAVAGRAVQTGATEIDVVLAGGGSHLPFLQDLVRQAGSVAARGVTLRVAPLSPANVLYEGVDPELTAAFPQIAMSVGGALVEMLAPAA